MLRELLTTWENWNSRTTLINTLLRGHGDDARWHGHTWPQIADALGATVEQARASYGEVIDRQERLLGHDVDLYRVVL